MHSLKYVSQFMDPVEWLQSALSLFNVSNIVENTTHDAEGRLWTCELSFHIPTRGPSVRQQLIHQTGRPAVGKRFAQRHAVHLCLVALKCICIEVPDYSDFKVIALRAGRRPVAEVSEIMARNNVMDVVKSSLIFTSLISICCFYSINILWFFCLSTCSICSIIVPMLHVAWPPF
jgi:hypothetical protein